MEPDTSYMEDLWEQAYQEEMARIYADTPTTQTQVDTEEEDDEDRLFRLGINTTPRPEPVREEGTVIGFTGTNAWTTTITAATLQDAVATDMAVNGTMLYNGEELDARINRMVEERLTQYTESLDRYFVEVIQPYIETRIHQRREEQ